MWLYSLGFGACEVIGIPIRSFSLTWQVPARWLQGRSRTAQMFIWGIFLGPGLVTKNPYAGIWLLPLLLVLDYNRSIAIGVGASIGIMHGFAYALGILNNHKNIGGSCTHSVILAQWKWRIADGLALLLVAGGLTAYLFSPVIF